MVLRSISFPVVLSAILAVASCGDDDGDGTAATTVAASSSQAASSSVGGGGGMGGAGAAGGSGGVAGQGPGGGGSGGTSGYDGVACLKCINPLIEGGQKCEAPLNACKGNADCNAWLNCTQDCFQPAAMASCWDTCDLAHAAGKDVIDGFYACFCPDCSALCGTACD